MQTSPLAPRGAFFRAHAAKHLHAACEYNRERRHCLKDDPDLADVFASAFLSMTIRQASRISPTFDLLELYTEISSVLLPAFDKVYVRYAL
jgi:hypothetical protein